MTLSLIFSSVFWKTEKSVQRTPIIIIWMGLFAVLCSCQDNRKEHQVLFQSIHPNITGVTFNNVLSETDSINYFTYPYIYMGGGVSIGDINNDGLQDLFFTGNMVENRLYLNKGNFQFEDITDKAGLADRDRWCTGATMADVNNDGYLDIYVSVSGFKNANRRNLLYINNQDLSFSEEGQLRNADDNGHSTQGTFFDYDLDGDLDLYIANYPPTPFNCSNREYRFKMDHIKYEDSDRLLQNNGNGYFSDITAQSGLVSFGLSLSSSVGDFNNDGWPDIYVSNDFASPDFLYINNEDGTFNEKLKEAVRHTAYFGMGSDIADFNNDGLLDLIQVDMSPKDNFRSKANMMSMNPSRFWQGVNLGFHYQYMQNVLQLNQGIRADGVPFFSDISRLAGLSSTDWSWSPLFLDMDNDGWKDVLVTNGSRRDINNRDYFLKLEKTTHQYKRKEDYLEMSKKIPAEKIHNYAFKNNTDLTFQDVTQEWGINIKGWSNGAAYGDLDNDGDLDIVINNIDTIASILKNRSSDLGKNRYLRFVVNGPKKNPFGLGVRIELQHTDHYQLQELTLTRGFQSSVEPIVHFGTGDIEVLEGVKITWPDGKTQTLSNVRTNQILILSYQNAGTPEAIKSPATKPLFTEEASQRNLLYRHVENAYDDFRNEPLLPHRTSRFGPGIATGDINGDGLEDIFIGGARDSSGQLFLQGSTGEFFVVSGPWDEDSLYEDMASVFFDADLDGDQDLYVVSGGNSYRADSPYLQDRIYLNEGNLSFTKSEETLPAMLTSGSCVVPEDFDQDGDLDLFVGGRIVSQGYPFSPRSYLLENVSIAGRARFIDITESRAEGLINSGMVTDAVWIDYDNDNDKDLVITGEWMPISFYENVSGRFEDKTNAMGFKNSTGWWFSILADDFDNDGDLDLMAGNLGLNYKYKASAQHSFDIYAADYDDNGRLDIVLGYYSGGIQYPVRGRECSSEQIPTIRFKFKDYNSFANATLADIYTESGLEGSLHYQAWNFASSYIENRGDGTFRMVSLPNEVQISSINGMISDDFDGDGSLDVLAIGNMFGSEVETCRNDASYGFMLKGNGQGEFQSVPFRATGFLIAGDAKDISKLMLASGDELILVINNNDSLQVFRHR